MKHLWKLVGFIKGAIALCVGFFATVGVFTLFDKGFRQSLDKGCNAITGEEKTEA